MRVFGKSFNFIDFSIFSVKENSEKRILRQKINLGNQKFKRKGIKIAKFEKKLKNLNRIFEKSGAKDATVLLDRYFRDKKTVSAKKASLICG